MTVRRQKRREATKDDHQRRQMVERDDNHGGHVEPVVGSPVESCQFPAYRSMVKETRRHVY